MILFFGTHIMLLATFCDELAQQLDIISETNVYPYWVNDSSIAEIKYSESILRTIVSIFQTDTSKEINQSHLNLLSAFLDNRWQRVLNTDLSYPHTHNQAITKVCLYIANVIREHSVEKNNVYKILMPTIVLQENAISLTSLNDKDMQLHYFVLTDDNQRYIDVIECLNLAEKDCKFKETSLSNKELSNTEKNRVVKHSKTTKEYVMLIELRKTLNQPEVEIGKRLNQLYLDLTDSDKDHKGTEDNAGSPAYVGIARFTAWLETLDEHDRKLLFSLTSRSNRTTNFGEVWKQLTYAYNARHQMLIDCTQTLSFEIKHILDDNIWLYPKTVDGKTMLDLDIEIEHKRQELEEKLKNGRKYVVDSGYLNTVVKLNTPDFLYPALSSAKQIAILLANQPQETHLSLLKTIFHKSNKQTKWAPNEFIKIIKLLPKDQRYEFIESCFKDISSVIKDGTTLVSMLSSIHPDQAKTFLCHQFEYCLALITSGDDLIGLLKIADKDIQRQILKDVNHKLPDFITTPKILQTILATLELKERIEVLDCAYERILSFKLSLAEVNRFVLLLEDNQNKNEKQMKKTMSQLELYAIYPSLHKKLLKIINEAFQKDIVDKNAQVCLGNSNVKDKIYLSKQLNKYLASKHGFFNDTKPKGRMKVMIKHARRHFS